MKWNETTASQCRYGDIAARIWGDAEILWEDSDAGYQGHATIVARMPDGRYCFYEWWYGSCACCDDWEARDLSDDEIEQEMRETAVWFDNEKEFSKFLDMIASGRYDYYRASRRPDMEVLQMIDLLCGGTVDRLNRMVKDIKERRQNNANRIP
ncbi:MAG: hypothetical protein ACPL5F_01540 [Moorellaceae bacterium]